VNRLLDFREEETLPAGGLSRLQIASLGLQRVLEKPWFGYGLFTFQGLPGNSQQGTDILPVSVHNIYLTVAGETGMLSFVTYLFVIGLGLKRLAHMGGTQLERMTGTLMWLFYLLIGLVWHNQLTSAAGMVYIGLLLSLPAALPVDVMAGEAPEAPRQQIALAGKRL
jgi:O-antigen ligase